MEKHKYAMLGGGLLIVILAVVLFSGLPRRAAAGEPVQGAEVPSQDRTPMNGLDGINYQGYIEKDGQAYTGSCDFRFTVVGSPGNTKSYPNVNIQEGHFTVVLTGAWIDAPNGLYSLQVDAACPAGGTLTSLGLPQPVTTVPFARALAPYAVLRSPDSGGCAVASRNVTTDTYVLLGCSPRGLRDDELWPAGAANGATISVGGQHTESNMQVIHGMEVTGADVGLIVDGGTKGFDIKYPLGVGGIIRGSGLHGLVIDNPNRNGISVIDPSVRGLEIVHANEIGITIFDPVERGVYIEDSGGSGVSIYNAGNQGIYVQNSTNYDGSFQGNIYVGGACSGCALTNFAVNVGNVALEPGVPVTIVGVVSSTVREAPVLLQVRPAMAGEVVVGVVAGAAETVAAHERSASITGDVTAGQGTAEVAEMSIVPREGAAAPGGYLTVIRDGLARVKVGDANSDSIRPGMRLAVGNGVVVGMAGDAGDGRAALEGIGIAMSTPDAEGYIWAMITLR